MDNLECAFTFLNNTVFGDFEVIFSYGLERGIFNSGYEIY